MLYLALFVGLWSGALAQTYGAVKADASCTTGVGCKGYYRAFVATTLPLGSSFGPPSNVTGISVAAVGVKAQSDGTVTNAHVDLAGIKFKTPADTSDPNGRSLAFYFGYLGVSGTWNNDTKTAAVAGALCEVFSSLHSIQVYYDRDGEPGFQWDMTNGNTEIFTCAAGGTYDCIDVNGSIEMENLTWSFISRTVDKCVDKLPPGTGGDYDPDNCTILTLTTAGSLNGAPVLSLEIRTVSQPLTINGVLHTPDKAKWDVRIQYPWAVKNIATPAQAKIALVAVHAGKAVSAASVATVNAGGATKALTWTAVGGKQAYFGYSTSVTIDGAASTVITKHITDADIQAFQGNLIAAPTTALVTGGWKLIAGVLRAFLWIPQITVHSFPATQPNNIFWDPEDGIMQSPAMLAAPSLLLMALSFLS